MTGELQKHTFVTFLFLTSIATLYLSSKHFVINNEFQYIENKKQNDQGFFKAEGFVQYMFLWKNATPCPKDIKIAILGDSTAFRTALGKLTDDNLKVFALKFSIESY